MRHMMLMVIVAIVTLLHFLLLSSLELPNLISNHFISFLSPTVTPSFTVSPTPTVTTQSGDAINPTILAALIGLGGVIVGAVIAGLFALSQSRQTAQREKERQAEQFKQEEKIVRLQKELEELSETKKQKQQNEAATAEALRLKMLLAPQSERTKMYREALHADPRISQLQILDMTRPLDVSNIYVRVRVHQETRPHYELDDETRRAELQRDPNALIQARFKYVEQRSSSAMDPDEAIRTYKRCVFVGDPGAGKTTLLKYLTLKSADGALDKLPDLPVRVELNAFVTSGYHDLLDYVAADWDERYGFPKSDARPRDAQRDDSKQVV